MQFVQAFLRPGDAFVDVGANVGTYSLLAAATPDVYVWAFEPSTQAFKRLKENIAINQLAGRVYPQQLAIGSVSGEAKVSTGRDAFNSVLFADGLDHEIVDMDSLDHILLSTPRRAVTLIKIDVEGFEERVLTGTSRLLAADSPVLIVEANDPPMVRDILAPLGYRAYAYHPSRRQLEEIDWLDIHDNNILAIRDRLQADARLCS